MIVVEGIDGTGKTTLVEHLKAKFPILEVRPSIGNKHDLKQIARQAHDESVHPHASRFMLTDRSRLISEYIYNHVLRNRPFAYEFDDWGYMLNRFAAGHHLVVWANRPIPDIVEGWDEEAQLEGVFTNLYRLHQNYELLMTWIAHLFDISQSGGRVVMYEFAVGTAFIEQNVEQYIAEVAG